MEGPKTSMSATRLCHKSDGTLGDAHKILITQQLNDHTGHLMIPRWHLTCPLPFGDHLQEATESTGEWNEIQADESQRNAKFARCYTQ